MPSPHHQAHNTSESPYRKRRSSKVYGRRIVLLLFVWLRMIDSGALFFVCPQLAFGLQQQVLLLLVVCAVWSTGLLFAIWFRQNWARYTLAGSIVLIVVFGLSMLPCLRDTPNPWNSVYGILGFTAAYLPVALILMASRDVCELTERRLE